MLRALRDFQNMNVYKFYHIPKIKMTTTVVVGLQYGGEGKGKIVDLLSKDYDYVVRYNGGNNAGHTIVRDGKKIVLHLVPSGIIDKKICVMGNGMVIDIEQLQKEINDIEYTFGFDPRSFLRISERAHIVLPKDIETSSHDKSSTGRGIKETYTRKAAREGIRMYDLLHLEEIDNLDPRLNSIRNDHDIHKLVELAEHFRSNTTDISHLLYWEIRRGKNVLFEGAQGTGLDINHGQYPLTTSSDCIAGGACTGAGIGPTLIDKVTGVAKVYTTRVDGDGKSPLPTQFDSELEAKIRTLGLEYGSTTDRARRIGWFDAILVKHAIEVNGVDEVMLTKLDILDSLDEIKICTSYLIDGKETNVYPCDASTLRRASPIYETMSGWKDKTRDTKSMVDLPTNAHHYINRLRAILNTKISYVSTGPDRNSGINVAHL